MVSLSACESERASERASVSVIPKRDRFTGVFGEGGCVRESIEVMN